MFVPVSSSFLSARFKIRPKKWSWSDRVNAFVYRFEVGADSLTITDVTEMDAGIYTCIMNTTLDHDSASAELTVVGTFIF